MSLTIRPGGTIVLDPNDKRVIRWDWDSENLSALVTIIQSTFTIDVIRQNGATALTSDNEAIGSGARTTVQRILATTATKGDKYRVNNQIITNESPDQQKERSYYVLIQQK
jgi:hypothetical protein